MDSATKSLLLDELRKKPAEPIVSNRRSKLLWVIAVIAFATAVVLFYRSTKERQSIVTAIAQKPNLVNSPGSEVLSASGYVVARRRATVSSKTTGRVMEIYIEEGQQVEADAVIARLDDSRAKAVLAQAIAQLAHVQAIEIAAESAYTDALPTFGRAKKQREAGIISAQGFDEATARIDALHNEVAVAKASVISERAAVTVAEREIDDTVVRAPFKGVITDKAAQPGEIVSPSTAGGGFTRTGIGTVVDMKSLEVEIDISEANIGKIAPNQPVKITLNAYNGWDIPGKVIAIIPEGDRAKGTVRVRIGMEKLDQRILPDMGVQVAFLNNIKATELAVAASNISVVPLDAVATSGPHPFVFVITDGLAHRQNISILSRDARDGQLTVSGILPYTRIAAGQLDSLIDGAHVSIRHH